MACSSLVLRAAAALATLSLARQSLAQTPPEAQPQATATQQPTPPPQPYPQQPYPPQGSAQQPYPQPWYPQQPYYAPPAPVPPPRRGGLLVLPYIGLHTFQNDAGDRTTDPGLRIGSFLGGRGSQFSLNGELNLDVINPNSGDETDVSAVRLDLAFSPLAHIQSGDIEFVIGPKLGVWVYALKGEFQGENLEARGYGMTYGLNTGVFGRLANGMGVGGLVGYQWSEIAEFCIEQGGEERCLDSNEING